MNNAQQKTADGKRIPPKRNRFYESWRVFASNKSALIGLVVIIILFAVAFVGPRFYPMSGAIRANSATRLLKPSSEHLLGTDGMGRDVLARIVNGAQVSLTMGFIPITVSVAIGMLLGSLAAYSGGWIDNLIMRLCDVFACIPGVLLTLTMVSILGAGLNNMFIAITISCIPGQTRFIRSVVLNIVELDYVEAGRACGTKPLKIMRKHVLPNAFGPIVLSATSGIAGMIMMGAGLSFLGLGIQPPYPEWGAMLGEALAYVRVAPWLFYFPGLAIMISVLVFNLAGDGLRDALDPKLKR